MHPSHESMVRYPPPGFHFASNVRQEVFDEFEQPPGYVPLRRKTARLMNRVFRLAAAPRMVPILSNSRLIHVDGCIVPLTHRPWIIGSIEYPSAFFSFDDTWHTQSFSRSLLLKCLSSGRCRKILALSEASLASIRLAFGRDFEKISPRMDILYPAVPTNRLSVERLKRDSGEPLRILFVGNHFLDKGGREIFYAFRRLRQRFDIELALVTSAPPHHKEYYDLMLPILKNEPGVEVHSRLPRSILWQEYFAKSDIFCFPTYMDTFGYVILEAMANRLPVIASDMFAIPEIVRHEETGLLVHAPIASFERNRLRSPDTVNEYRRTVLCERVFSSVVDSLESAITLLIEDDSCRRRLAAAGYREVSEGRFSVKHRNVRLSRFYRNAME